MAINSEKKGLGTKESGNNEDGLLGIEYVVADLGDDGKGTRFQRSASRLQVKWVKNTGATALVPGRAVKRDSTTNTNMHFSVVEASAADPCCGIVDPTLTSNVAVGEKFLIITKGLTRVRTGGAVARGAALGVGANGVAATNALSTVADLTHVFGVLQETAGVAGLFRAEVDFRTVK